jgi:hypothetical protein
MYDNWKYLKKVDVTEGNSLSLSYFEITIRLKDSRRMVRIYGHWIL